MRHIRNSEQGGRDKRSRAGRFFNNAQPTICGAEPTADDKSKRDAAHLMFYAQAQPARLGHWVQDLCPECMAKVTPAPKSH